jgi:hypothetical protein
MIGHKMINNDNNDNEKDYNNSDIMTIHPFILYYYLKKEYIFRYH